MGTWQDIFKKKGRFFLKPQEDMRDIIQLFKKEKVRRVLDLGCGSGRHVVMLAKAGFEVYGTDVSKEGLKLSRRWLKEAGLNARLKQESCYRKFSFKDDFFDAVISIQVIHHARIRDVRRCISEIERVLRPGGIVFITVTKSSYRNRATKFKIIEPRTYVMLDGLEKGVPHYIYTKSLMRKEFRNFKILDLHTDSRSHYCL